MRIPRFLFSAQGAKVTWRIVVSETLCFEEEAMADQVVEEAMIVMQEASAEDLSNKVVENGRLDSNGEKSPPIKSPLHIRISDGYYKL